MQKRNEGITLITLVIVIIVLVILSSIFISASLKALNETRSSEIQNEIHALEEAVNDRYASYLKSNGSVALVGSAPTWSTYSDCVDAIIASMEGDNLTAEELSAKRTRIQREIERDYDKYVKIVGKQQATELGVDSFSTDDNFIVDYYTAKVYGPIE